jgi:hypothetical protein
MGLLLGGAGGFGQRREFGDGRGELCHAVASVRPGVQFGFPGGELIE